MSKKRRNALGRGLGALLEDSTISSDSSKEIRQKTNDNSANFKEIELTQIETNPYQPRDYFDEEALNELAESIKVHGIIQPITVRKLDNTHFQLISGERRFQASKRAGLETVPAFIRTANDQQMLEMALIENIQRENLNAIEVALSYQRLMSECELKQEELGDRVGKNRTTVNNYLRLLKLPPTIQSGIKDQEISMGHARAIVNVEDADVQLSIYKKIISDALSVRKVEELVRNLDEQKSAVSPKRNTETLEEVKSLQTKLSSHFGTRISVKSNQKYKGEIKIPFVSLEDLNRILEILDA